MSLKAGVTLTKVNAGQEVPKTPLQPYKYDELGGYGRHKLSALIVIADASGAVSAGLDYTLSIDGSTLHMQAAAPPIQNLKCGAKHHHRCHPFKLSEGRWRHPSPAVVRQVPHMVYSIGRQLQLPGM